MPSPAAIDRSSGRTMADRPSPRVRRRAPLAEAGASPSVAVDVVGSLMVSLTVILSGIQPIVRRLVPDGREVCAHVQRAGALPHGGCDPRGSQQARYRAGRRGVFAGGRLSALDRSERTGGPLGRLSQPITPGRPGIITGWEDLPQASTGRTRAPPRSISNGETSKFAPAFPAAVSALAGVVRASTVGPAPEM